MILHFTQASVFIWGVHAETLHHLQLQRHSVRSFTLPSWPFIFLTDLVIFGCPSLFLTSLLLLPGLSLSSLGLV
jgi:hypothetical protein